MMRLTQLLAPWFDYQGQAIIAELQLDSRQVQANDLFMAIPGLQVDGRQFIGSALRQGAGAVLIHTDEPDLHGKPSEKAVFSEQEVALPQVPQLYFYQLAQQVSALAAHRYQVHPSFPLVGITGTNGKTSISQLIAQLVALSQQSAAVMGTMGNGIWHVQGAELVESGNTTADPITVMRSLRGFIDQQVQLCAMEVSSHGLSQGRVSAVPFQIAVMSNLTRDHLDYHGDMESYGAAKKQLFAFDSLQDGLLNLDDPTAAKWYQEFSAAQSSSSTAQQAACRYFGYSMINPQAAYQMLQPQYHGAGVRAMLQTPQGQFDIDSPLLGAFNLSNLLAALAVLELAGFEMRQIAPLCQQLQPVAGRMECFSAEKQPTLVVDYAHTPDGLVQALKAARQHCQGKLWCVFGCGGDRDSGKRPLMAAAAEQFADHIMLTNDNSRSEDPLQIIKQMQQGLSKPLKALSNIDRQQAIREVFAQANAGDLILLAGKGHETYQEIAGVKYDYSERDFAKKLLKEGQ